MLTRIVAAMRNSPITPPPATFSCPRVPSVSFDVCEAVKKHQEISVVPNYYSVELLPFYKNAIWQLKERLGSADRQFMSMARQSALSQMKTEVALLLPNRLKNRYQNVLPCDDTRVKLDATSGSNISNDYVNANFLTDPVREDIPVFIATQAPLNTTVVDFWHMVMQQKCPVVVMLTKLQDGSQERCAHYFPTGLNQSEQFGQLRVTNKSANFLRDHRTLQRVLEIQGIRDSSSTSHTVIHLEFRDWPDFGVPSSTAPVREMIRSLQCVPASAGPFVIHCSAGIGRTGTFCAAYHSIVRILAGDETALDVGQTVLQFRSQRSGIVQTKEQYRFIFTAVINELEEIVGSLTGST